MTSCAKCAARREGIVKWQDFQEHLPAGRQGTRSNGLGHPAGCISAGNFISLRLRFQDLPATLTTLVSAYTTAKNAAIVALAAAEQKTADKDDALENLTDAMKSDIRYAENKVNYDDDKLKLIGWAGKKAPTALQPPGQARLLEAPRQGEGWVFLDWKAPIDGGAPSAYKISRRERPAGPWEDVGTAIESESTLVEQPRGKELEYRIIAINKAGEGEVSNTAMVVL